ncbi:MAG: T9SS type A sorting domain-containing protein, partial [Chitinophagaceae bacterium]|nr:T9SS type A sorting domain-containing protein [Chitinophagaceae bacterium]
MVTGFFVFYRLQIVSRQLVKSYSSIIKVNLSPQPVTVQVYPNPVHDIITISFNSKQPVWSVKLLSLQGSLLKSYKVEAASHIQLPVQW